MSDGFGFAGGFALIVVLFILLVIVGAGGFLGGCGGYY
ncbi:YjcZ family sporulation protein [Lederbergia ruris]|nr:YjcZ family sporulation protein [Lederbergia ruris]